MASKVENSDKDVTVSVWHQFVLILDMGVGDQVCSDTPEMESKSYADVWCLLPLQVLPSGGNAMQT